MLSLRQIEYTTSMVDSTKDCVVMKSKLKVVLKLTIGVPGVRN